MSGAGRSLAAHLAFRAARVLLARLPERAALGAGRALGLFVGTVLRVRRADVDRHLEIAFPEQPRSWRRAVARRCYAHFGREAALLFRPPWPPHLVRERTRTIGFDDFRRAAAAGKGVVLLTGHVGNWEIGGAAIVARGVPLDVVSKGATDRRFEAEVFAARERLGMRVVPMGDAPSAALRALGQGSVVALLADQSPRAGGVPLPFFGRVAATARGPAVFALRTGAPVWVAFALRDAGPEPRYTVTFERLAVEPTGSPEEDVHRLLSAYHGALERAVRGAPEQYFWQHRRWKRSGVEGTEEPAPPPPVTTPRP